MTQEVLRNFDNRQPAIPAEALLLQDGTAFNKYTAQKLALQAGLPVPQILKLSSVKEMQIKALQDYYTDHEDKQIVIRGIFNESFDSWTVDTTPTEKAYLFDLDIQSTLRDIFDEFRKPLIQTYLRTNFGITKTTPQVFFQENVIPDRRDEMYLSTWRFGDMIYGCLANSDRYRTGGKRWFTYNMNNGYFTGNDSNLSYVFEHIYPIIQAADETYNAALGRTSHYKHDFITEDLEAYYLIQSRVASPAYSSFDLGADKEKIKKYKADKVPVCNVEVGTLGLFGGEAPKSSYLINLKNDDHHGEPTASDYYRFDMRNLAGLILPDNLRGGLLDHGAYTLIAYCLYWGLPISIGGVDTE